MSAARTARRKRIQMKNDNRYRRRDPETSSRKLARQIEKARKMAAKK